MATLKPLTLRRQRAATTSNSHRDHSASLQAEVLVDTGVYHLGDPYSYSIPTNLANEMSVGSVVSVPFASGTTSGIVLSIGPMNRAGLRTIRSITHENAIPTALLNLAGEMANDAICNPFDVYRNILPVATKGSVKGSSALSQTSMGHKSEMRFVQATIGEANCDLLLGRILKDLEAVRLVIFPTVRDVKAFVSSAIAKNVNLIEYGSHLSLSARKRAFNEIVAGGVSLVVGTRSAIFAPMEGVKEIVVVDEWSEHYCEQRAPYWNLRDVAIARAVVERSRLFFLSSSASLEMMQHIEQGRVIQSRRPRLSGLLTKTKVTCAPQSYLAVVRDGLKRGPVLITVAEKNFSNLFLCQRCRSVARCKCGGRIVIATRGEFVCSLCTGKTHDWRCEECSSNQFIMIKSGIEKVKEEISKSIPNIPIYTSTQEKESFLTKEERVIVIATSGMEPTCPEGYSAIILLDGEQLVSRPFVRSEEELLQRWFKTLQLLQKSGDVFLSLPSHHRISQSVIANDPMKYLRNELSERQRLGLPPSQVSIRIESKGESLSSLRARLLKQFPSSKIHLSGDSFSLLMLLDSTIMRESLMSLRALQKVRSMQSKSVYRITINPYHL
ncbi:MAG: hypothetical protein ACKOFL_00240 [Actinomycetota bacterium]